MKQYLKLLARVLSDGSQKGDRTGTGTTSVFGERLEFNLKDGFPLLTTKRVNYRSILHELFWFLNGDTNTKYLQENNVHIWDEWADKNGDLGKIYGYQLIKSNGINQIEKVISQIKNDSDSRRIIVSAWNVAELDEMNLPPCHLLFQFYCDNKRNLSCQVYQRSADVFLGLPFNIASYAFLVHIIAQQTHTTPHKLVWIGGDTHLYNNHLTQAREQLQRSTRITPELILKPKNKYNEYLISDFLIKNYNPHPAIKAPISV